jgi:Kef-type K+ transport system membrane component KefB
MATILPEASAPFLGIIAQLGIILYMFLVGLELDLKLLRNSGHKTLMISHASIVVPFVSGALLAILLFPSYAPTGVSFTTFSLFLGVSMAITAFPVLARILNEKGLSKTPLGAMALTCAAIDDVTAWCLLAFVTSVAQASILSAVSTILLTIAYIAFMFVLMKPIAQKGVAILERSARLSEGNLAIILLALLISALATEFIGIHAIFGAFLLGAVTPHDSRVAKELTERLQDLVQVLFLPAFFAFTGMRTQIGLLSGPDDWKICGIIILVAIAGKFIGTIGASRMCGIRWRESCALGVLMNTRGLVELIVLNIGLDLGVISPRLFTMLVIMALVTTFMTGPALSLFIDRQKNPSTA